MILPAVTEEILFRGILFRLLEEKLGSYYALAVSAALFGLIHFINPHISWITCIILIIQAGLLLGAAYIYSRSLWFSIAIHFAWNYSQSGIFSASTSGGGASKSLFTAKIEGTTLITGGKFGPESSVEATLFCFVVAVILLIMSRKVNKIVSPLLDEKI